MNSGQRKCQMTKGEKAVHAKQLWRVTCSGNRNVEYQVLGILKPRHCPACGRDAIVVTV